MLITSFRISEQLTSSAFDDNNLMGRAYEHFKETGLHITLDELSTWVDQVQQNPAAAVPVCRT